MALDDRGGDIAELAAVVLRVVAQHLEGAVGGRRLAGHQDAFGLFDQRAAAECSLQALVLGEALQGDVDRALQLVGGAVDDVGEDAPLGCLVDVGRVAEMKDRDDRTGGFADDLGDQLERVHRAFAEPDEGDVGLLSGGDGADFLDVDLARDHLVPEPRYDLCEQLEPVSLLVRDQYTQVLGLGHAACKFSAGCAALTDPG
jgi:hypothetical protein